MRKWKKRAKDKVGKGARGQRVERRKQVEDGKKEGKNRKGPKTHEEMEVVGERQ